MAIDFLIFALILISFVINLLALGAFWVTPGLRTTANRFVINLLVINLIGCFILAPTLFLTGSRIATAIRSHDDSLKILTKADDNHRNLELEETVSDIIRNDSDRTETILKCNSSYCEKLIIEEHANRIVITEMNEQLNTNDTFIMDSIINKDKSKIINKTPMIRCWTIDLAAALGALSVLLVVGDTWCAVTDPLRYHTRISGLRSWVLIGLTWSLGILFGVMSAMRGVTFESATIISKQKRYALHDQIGMFSVTSNTVFSMIFACVYFIVIILLPFGFVCGMYWRIFSEARENGLRMRQNGSSPLLQSALNLSHGHHHGNAHTNNLYVHRNSLSGGSTTGGLQMQIDHKRGRRDSSVTIAGIERNQRRVSSTPPPSLPPLTEPEETTALDRNTNNILLTLSAASGEIKRNYSVRQLPILGRSSQDLIAADRLQGIRQIHSSPNLQKYTQPQINSPIPLDAISPHRNTPAQALQIPANQPSPKALSYMTSIRHRLSNASSLFKYREESRAARISILVVIMFLVSYLPYGFLVLLQGRVIDDFVHSTQLAIFMILLANLSSPFIFAYRNKRIRRGVKRLFGLRPRSEERHIQQKAGLLRYTTKASIKVKRNSSKLSTYSINSCKYLTPILRRSENKFNSNTETFPVATTIIPSSSSNTYPTSSLQQNNILENIAVDTTISLQTTTAHQRRSIFKIFCQSSRSLSCGTQACTADNEPIEV